MSASGTSAKENLVAFRSFVEQALCQPGALRPSPLILDVGAGQGAYADALAGLSVVIEAVEAWEPTIKRFGLEEKYSFVYHTDVRDLKRSAFMATDLVIFGDVLEHLPLHDAHVIWDLAYSAEGYVLASVPNSPYPQGAIEGNHFEEHLILDPVRDLIEHLPEPIDVWEYPVTSTFIWKKGSDGY